MTKPLNPEYETIAATAAAFAAEMGYRDVCAQAVIAMHSYLTTQNLEPNIHGALLGRAFDIHMNVVQNERGGNARARA